MAVDDVSSPSHPEDPAYRDLLRQEEEYWEHTPLNVEIAEGLVPPELHALLNRQYTGSAKTTWMQELASRGPFESVAMLGSTSGYYEALWLQGGGSRQLDLYDVGATLGKAAETSLEALGFRDRVHFRQVDLNFAAFPDNGYDLIFAVSTLHHLVRLEHLFEDARRALRPGGLFAFLEYVGPRRVQFEEARLELARAVSTRIPERFRRAPVANVPEGALSPFEARRSDEILPICREYFEQIHLGHGIVLAPLWFTIDLRKLAQFRPDVLRRVVIPAEVEAENRFSGSTAYGVFQKKG